MSPGQSWALRELADTLCYELEQQGVPSSVHLDGFPAPREGLVYGIVGPRTFVEVEGIAALPDDAVLARTVFVCTESPDRVAEPAHVALLERAGVVFNVEVRSVLELHRAGLPARTLKPGYSRQCDHYDDAGERPIDILVLGADSRRRRLWAEQFEPVLARYRSRIELGAPLATDAKWDLLAQTKVLVNLHRQEQPYLEWLRVLDAIHAGAVVVTEHSSGLAPLAPGEHLMVGAPAALPHIAAELLHDEQRLSRIRMQAYERIRDWLPFALSIGVLRAALVELVGVPLPQAAGA